MTDEEIEFQTITINGRLMTTKEFMAYLNGRVCAQSLLPIQHNEIILDDLRWSWVKGYGEAYMAYTAWDVQ